MSAITPIDNYIAFSRTPKYNISTPLQFPFKIFVLTIICSRYIWQNSQQREWSNNNALVLTLSDVSNNSVAINSPSVFRSCSSSDSSSCILRRRLNLFYKKFIRNTVNTPYHDYRTTVNISYTRIDTKVHEFWILMIPVNIQYQTVDATV